MEDLRHSSTVHSYPAIARTEYSLERLGIVDLFDVAELNKIPCISFARPFQTAFEYIYLSHEPVHTGSLD